jgi:hypothetical protein
MDFLQFNGSCRILSPSKSYESTIAADNGIDESWWLDPECSDRPYSFLIFAGEAWIVMLESGTCFTMIEGKEYTGSLPTLVRLLFAWFSEDSGSHCL